MIRLAINGALGRMGRVVGALALESGTFDLISAIESPASASLGQDYGTLLGRGRADVEVEPTLSRQADVLVDFSTPAAAMLRLAECVKLKTAAVICTTGLGGRESGKIRDASKKIPLLQASNTSVGVAALMRAVPELARLLGDAYDIEIVETHHRAKKDAPSGTAVSLAERLAGATGRTWPSDFTFGRKGSDKPRGALEIGIHAVRAGGVIGEHTVIFASDDDVITVTHRAGSRDLFARGALRAAEFAARAKPGLYGMNDVLTQPSPP
jgi:4-hydroxy-tetrahydrodipicolinate reductase